MANLKIISHTLQNNQLDEGVREDFLQNLNKQLIKLEFILDALVKCSRLETGMIVLTKNKYDAQEVFSDVITLALPLLTQKKQQITLDVAKGLMIYADKKWLTESSFNIIENAIKYTPEQGIINITITKNEMYTVISIKDTGCGVKESDFGNIFNRFYRGENTSEIEGVGIGLCLSREVISLHNGYITVHSTINKGSTFEIHLLNYNR